jgi:hypothetical protein
MRRLMSVLVLVAVSTTTGAAQAPPGRSPGIWIATRTNVETLEGLDPGLTARFFDGPASFVLDGWNGATTAMGWASVAAFESDLAAGAIPDSVRLVMYDPEAWSHTPLPEQRDPTTWMRRFASDARGAGYLVMMTPHPSLVTVPGAVCGRGENEGVVAAFLRCRIAEVAGATADVVDLQLQALQKDPVAYRRAFVAADSQARAADPNVEVLAHLTTALAPEAPVLFAAWQAVGDVADGLYLGMPGQRRPEVALAFLRLVSITSRLSTTVPNGDPSPAAVVAKQMISEGYSCVALSSYGELELALPRHAADGAKCVAKLGALWVVTFDDNRMRNAFIEHFAVGGSSGIVYTYGDRWVIEAGSRSAIDPAAAALGTDVLRPA